MVLVGSEGCGLVYSLAGFQVLAILSGFRGNLGQKNTYRVDQNQRFGFLRQEDIVYFVFQAIHINRFHDRMLRNIILLL